MESIEIVENTQNVRRETPKVDILHGKESKVILQLAFPIFFGMLFQLLYNITDTYWVSRIDLKDPSYVGAVGIVFPIFFLSIAIVNGLTTGITAYVARAIGAGREDVLSSVYNSMMLIAIFLAVAFIFLGYFFQNEILTFFGAKNKYLVHSIEYADYIFPAMAILFVGSVYIGILQGKGDMTTVMMAMFLATVFNIILDPILIFTFDLNIKGAAIATLISQVLAMTYILLNYYKSNKEDKFRINLIKIDFKVVKEVFSVGFTQSLNQILIAISYILFNYYIIRISENALTAFAICGRIDQLLIIPIIAVSIALVTAIGQNHGEGKYRRVKNFWKIGNSIALVTVAILAAILITIAPFVMKQFSDVSEVVGYAVMQVRMIEIGFLFVVVHTLACSFFQATNQPRPAVMLILLRLLVLPIFAITTLLALNKLTIMGIWISILVVNLIAAVVSWVWVHTEMKRLILKQDGILERND